jgi:hypothetical protein
MDHKQLNKTIMQLIFDITSTVLFLIFGIIWSKKTFLDVIVKTICIGLSISGIILILGHYGYIIKQ